MEIRTLNTTDARAFREIRLRALQEHPEAFGRDYAEESGLTMEAVANRLRSDPERFVLGAWEEGTLCGMVGFHRYPGRKTRHRAMLSSMYVIPAARRRGLGTTLLRTVIERAQALDGLEELILAVTVGNGAARSLYYRLGFELSHIEKRYIKIDERYYDIEWLTLLLKNNLEENNAIAPIRTAMQTE